MWGNRSPAGAAWLPGCRLLAGMGFTFLFGKLAKRAAWLVAGGLALPPFHFPFHSLPLSLSFFPYIISAFMLFYVLLIDVSALEAIYIPFLAKESAKELRHLQGGGELAM